MTQLLVPGLTCAQTFEPPTSGVLVDGCDFYRAVYDACSQAKRSILMLGWQFSSKVELVRGDEAGGCERPVRFVDFLRALCEERPELEVHILAWDASAVFAFEREPLQRWMFSRRGHKRIHYKMDNAHPVGASHHQKLVVVDRSIAFVGGMDICTARWDDRKHPAESATRCSGEAPHDPYHDVQAFITGDAVDTLREWFCIRWERATKQTLELPAVERTEIAIKPSFPVEAPVVALARTLPREKELACPAVLELYELHLRAIAQAERLIYIENQYLSSDEIGSALEERMRRPEAPCLEIVIVLPEKSAGMKERISIGVYQARILQRLTRVAEETGHHLGVYFTCACDESGDVPTFIHAKVLAVDDRFLLVSSANTSNRSMGFDTELGIAWEAPARTDSLARARCELLAEHVGVSCEDGLLAIDGLVARLDSIARAKSHRLRIHRRNQDELPSKFWSRFIPDETPFDPDNPGDMAELLPEPGAWLDRLFRDPLAMVRRSARGLRRARR